MYYLTSSEVPPSIEVCFECIGLLWFPLLWHLLDLHLGQPHDETLRIEEQDLDERVLLSRPEATDLEGRGGGGVGDRRGNGRVVEDDFCILAFHTAIKGT